MQFNDLCVQLNFLEWTSAYTCFYLFIYYYLC
jgi:hypothetical protein